MYRYVLAVRQLTHRFVDIIKRKLQRDYKFNKSSLLKYHSLLVPFILSFFQFCNFPPNIVLCVCQPNK